MAKKVAVIGGGIAGLTCAYRIQQSGAEICVFEAEKTIGGRLKTVNFPTGFADMGAQILSRTYLRTYELCRELGLLSQWRPLECPKHYILMDGQWKRAPCETLSGFFSIDYLPMMERAKLLLFYLKHQKFERTDVFSLTPLNRQVPSETASRYVTRWVGKEAERKVFDACLAAYHFHDLDEAGEEIVRGLVGAYSDKYTYDYLEGGISLIAETLAQSLTVHGGCRVERLERRDHQWHVHSALGEEAFDAAVLAVPASKIAHFYRPETPLCKQLIGQVDYSSTITLLFEVPTDLYREIGLILIPRGESSVICSALVNAMKEGRDKKVTHLVLFLHSAAATELMECEDAVILQSAAEEWARIAPGREIGRSLKPIAVQRWREAIPKYTSQLILDVAKFMESEQGANSLYLCGDYMNAPWVEGSIRCAEEVASRVIKKIEMNDRHPPLQTTR